MPVGKYRNDTFTGYKTAPSSERQSSLVVDYTEFDISKFPGFALALNEEIDLYQIPAGHELVPHLCRIMLPDLDAGGAPTAQVQIGTEGTPAALLAATAVGSAATDFSGEDFNGVTGRIGSLNADTPLKIRMSTAPQTQVTTGIIRAWVAYRGL